MHFVFCKHVYIYCGNCTAGLIVNIVVIPQIRLNIKYTWVDRMFSCNHSLQYLYVSNSINKLKFELVWKVWWWYMCMCIYQYKYLRLLPNMNQKKESTNIADRLYQDTKLSILQLHATMYAVYMFQHINILRCD